MNFPDLEDFVPICYLQEAADLSQNSTTKFLIQTLSLKMTNQETVVSNQEIPNENESPDPSW